MKTYNVRCDRLTVNAVAELEDMLDDSDVQIMFDCDDRSEYPLPWDAMCSIQVPEFGQQGRPVFVLQGGAGASGWGSCTVHVPLADATMYRVQVELFNDDDRLPPALAAVAEEGELF
jgi:hypothetical protein